MTFIVLIAGTRDKRSKEEESYKECYWTFIVLIPKHFNIKNVAPKSNFATLVDCGS